MDSDAVATIFALVRSPEFPSFFRGWNFMNLPDEKDGMSWQTNKQTTPRLLVVVQALRVLWALLLRLVPSCGHLDWRISSENFGTE